MPIFAKCWTLMKEPLLLHIDAMQDIASVGSQRLARE
jgi:hypothetical protein